MVRRAIAPTSSVLRPAGILTPRRARHRMAYGPQAPCSTVCLVDDAPRPDPATEANERRQGAESDRRRGSSLPCDGHRLSPRRVASRDVAQRDNNPIVFDIDREPHASVSREVKRLARWDRSKLE